ncbi:hypothetical protein D3C87_1165680 [compost metagenome]
MQGDDARQPGHAADERREVVIGTGDGDLDRQFDVERLGDLGQQFDFLKLQAATQAGAGDVFEQTGDFGITGQLPQQHAKGVLHFLHLLGVQLQVRRHMSLGGELFFERRFFLALEVKLTLQLTRGKAVTEREHQHHDQHAHQHLDRRRPGTDVAGIQFVDIDLAQPFEPGGRTHFPSSTAAG